VGFAVHDHAFAWLAQDDGELIALLWPPETFARFDPFEVFNSRVAFQCEGGKLVTVAGGFLPTAEPLRGGPAISARKVFAANSVTNLDNFWTRNRGSSQQGN
jgi:hypothetical protein